MGMKIEMDISESDEYGSYGTIKVIFDEASWLELEIADAHRIGPAVKYSQGGKLIAHHADGTEDLLWDGTVMPKYYAERQRKLNSGM